MSTLNSSPWSLDHALDEWLAQASSPIGCVARARRGAWPCSPATFALPYRRIRASPAVMPQKVWKNPICELIRELAGMAQPCVWSVRRLLVGTAVPNSYPAALIGYATFQDGDLSGQMWS